MLLGSSYACQKVYVSNEWRAVFPLKWGLEVHSHMTNFTWYRHWGFFFSTSAFGSQHTFTLTVTVLFCRIFLSRPIGFCHLTLLVHPLGYLFWISSLTTFSGQSIWAPHQVWPTLSRSFSVEGISWTCMDMLAAQMSAPKLLRLLADRL